MATSLLLLSLLLSLGQVPVQSMDYMGPPPPARDYCQSETFTAKCWTNEVIMMTSAVFGRMELGRCVESDLGYLGCSTDVLHMADRWCSGKRSCNVGVPNKDLDETRPCFSELKTFLKAGYKCIKVAVGEKSYCSSNIHKLKLHSKEGNLASSVTDETGCGSTNNPWIIEAMPGQTVNVSLLDFDVAHLADPIREFNPGSDRCHVYGYIVEREKGVNKTICGGRARQSIIHQSNTNKLEVYLIPSARRKRNGTFVVSYNTLGCPDLNPPEHAWYKREGDLAVIGCEWTEKTWHLKCNGNQWIGVVGNCSAPTAEQTAAATQEGGFPFSSSLSIVIVIGLAVVIACIILCIGLVCIVSSRKGKYRRQSESVAQRKPGSCPESQKAIYQAVSLDPEPHNERDPGNQRLIRQNLGVGVPPTATDPGGPGNDYTHIWETPLPGEPHSGGNMTSDSDYASQSNFSTTTTRQSHLNSPYEGISGRSVASFGSSLGDRPEEGSGMSPRYFVLDRDKL